MNRIFVIAFDDGDNKGHYYRHEEDNCYGKVMTFETEIECKRYMFENLDVRAYSYYCAEISKAELNEANKDE